MLVRLDRLEPDRLQVVDRGAEPDRLGDRRGAGLELRGQLAPASSSRRRRCGSCGRRAGTAPSRAGARCGPRGSRSRSGRSILWPETAMKSAPSAWTSRRTCGAAWAASQVRIAPRSCAQAASRGVSAIVPSEFETTFAATTFTFSSVRDLVEQQVAVVVDRDDPELGARCGSRRTARARSSSGARAGSRARRRPGRAVRARRRRRRGSAPSVALRTKMISRSLGAFTNARTFSRAPSRPAVARSPSA